MTNFVFNHDPKKLPPYDDFCHPVQIYDTHHWDSLSSSCIARRLIGNIRDLGCRISNDSFDFLTIAMAVTAADTFSLRENSENAWSRELSLQIPLYSPEKWNDVSKELEKALCFLTGDMWDLKFLPGGLISPLPKKSKNAKAKKQSLLGLDCICLFSGGLDSAVGAIDLINSGFKKPLLVSHAYRGDASKQRQAEKVLLDNCYSRLAFNADPHIISLQNKTDITMRGRSFNFIAMAIIGLSALQKINGNHIRKIYIPENGYISLNPPLTRRRIGSFSTRTTHPYFLSKIQQILNSVGFNVTFENPYKTKTKGEMLKECKDQQAIEKVIPMTVSCSNWHRKGIQCGRCVPCIIRRAAVFSSNFSLDAGYESKNLRSVLNNQKEKDDLISLSSAILRLSKSNDIFRWVRESGPLPDQDNERRELKEVFSRGLLEVYSFLKSEKVL